MPAEGKDVIHQILCPAGRLAHLFEIAANRLHVLLALRQPQDILHRHPGVSYD